MKQLKVYTDATVVNDKAGIGYIIKDQDNKIVNVTESVIYESYITQAEIKAVIDALQKAKQLCNSIILYTDNYSIVDMFERDANPNKDDIHGLMWNLRKVTSDINVELKHVKSENNPADFIAKNAVDPSDASVGTEYHHM